MFCQKCGAAVQDGAAFCANCGTKVAVATPNTSVIKENPRLEPSPPVVSPIPEIKTNVKQGASIGGWLCFILGLFVMYISLWAFYIYAPLLLVALVLGIVAMAQRRILMGIALLLSTLIIPPVFGLLLSAHRLNPIKEKTEQSMRQSSPPPLKQPDVETANPTQIEVTQPSQEKTEQSIRQSSPSPSEYDRLADEAMTELASKNWSRAIELSDMALKIRPNDSKMLQLVVKVKEGRAEELCATGKQLAERGEPGQAMEAYLKGLEDIPNQQRIEDAITELQKARPFDPVVFQHLGHTIKADGEIHRIVIAPDNQTLICGTGWVQFPGGVYFYDLKDLHPIGWHASGQGNDDDSTATCVSADGKVAIAAGVVMDLTQWISFSGCRTKQCARLSDEVRRAKLDQEAFLVIGVVPDSAGALADIRVGDLLLEEPDSFKSLKPGDVENLTVIRDGKKEIHPLKLQAMPRTLGTIPYAIKSSTLHPSGELMMEWGNKGMEFYSPTQGSLVGCIDSKQYKDLDCMPIWGRGGTEMFTPDGSVFVMASHRIVALDITNGQMVWELPGHLAEQRGQMTPPVDSMSLSPDESLLATITQKEAIVWDLKKQKEIVTIKTHKNHWEAYNECVSISPDATRLVIGSKDGMYVWDIATGRLLRSFPKVSTYEIKWTTDGRCMITRNGGWVNIWGVEGANLMLEAREVKCKSPRDLRVLNNMPSQGGQNRSISVPVNRKRQHRKEN